MICDLCHKPFTKGWSDEKATAELQTVFPSYRPFPSSFVCATCYDRIVAEVETELGLNHA